MDTTTPCVSFIGIVDFSQEARWIYMTDSVTDLLGFEPHELVGRPSLELVHPDEFPRVRQLHYDTIQQDKAAVLVYLRMRHKDPYKGYILCGISRTVVHNVLVGSVSFASPGAKALHNASTAQEITVISPSAQNFQFRRWHDPSPMPPSPIPRSISTPSPAPTSPSSSWQSPSPPPCSTQSPTQSHRSRSGSQVPSPSSPEPHHQRNPPSYTSATATTTTTTTSTYKRKEKEVITFDHLPNQSFRTAFILNRFSVHCNILYCSNDLLISTTECIGRPFFDYVSKRDEEQVRSWIDCVKGWGVNERGQPSDGGFGFGRFVLLTEGRDSIGRIPDPIPNSRRSRASRTLSNPLGSPTRTRHRRLTHNSNNSPNIHSSNANTNTTNGNGRDRDPDSTSPPPPPQLSPTSILGGLDSLQFPVDAIFSAHSDGLMVILRRAAS